MNSSRPQATGKAQLSASIQWHFDWIDILVIPIATSIMEAQPFTLALLFFTLLFSGKSGNAPSDMLGVTILLLGLYWWAMLVKRLNQRGVSGRITSLLHALSLFVALVLFIAPRQWLLNNLVALVVVSICVLWCWLHSSSRTQIELSEEQLIPSFKVCFFALLIELLLAAFINQPLFMPMLNALAVALPLSFLSGLIALSGVRLSITKREFLRNPFSGSPDRIRAWVLFLALAWIMLMVVTLLLETIAFQPLLALLNPLIAPVTTLIEDGIAFILGLFGQKSQPVKLPQGHLKLIPPPRQSVPVNLSLSPILLTITFFIAGVLLLAGVLFILREMAFANAGKFGNEQRERLNARSILSERRRQRRQRHKTNFKLEPLDPASARAHYRDLLIVANKRGEPIARHPDETPSEYQRRLQSLATELSVRDGEQPGEIIVGELTRAYIPERYGKKSVKPEQSSYLRKWMPDFIKRLRHKKFLKQGKGQNKR